MEKLINFCGKYRKWIYAVLTIALLLVLCFPIQKIYKLEGSSTAQDSFKVPFFVSLPLCFHYLKYISTAQTPEKTLIILDVMSFCTFVAFLLLIIVFWIFTAKNKKFPFWTMFIPAIATYIFQGFFYTYTFETQLTPNNDWQTITQWQLNFNLSAPAIVLIVLICLYALVGIFFKLYPNMKVSETVGKVADKVRSHKSKSQRIEELERQNAEIQRQLDELKRKD